MELRHLRYFVTLAETLNFTRAAELLYISQSALSQQVADMEGELGVRLFRRTKRTVELTGSGRVLLNEARKILRQMEQVIPVVRNSALYEDQQRSILIGVDATVIHHSVCVKLSPMKFFASAKRHRDCKQIFSPMNTMRWFKLWKTTP